LGYEEFFAQNYERVVRSLTIALDDREAAEDAAQEAFAKAYRKWRVVQTHDEPSAWVYVVAVRSARRHWKRGQGADAPAVEASASGVDGLVTTRVAVREALARLSARQRVAVVLRYLVGMSLAETAEAMDCAVGTVKATVHQSLQRLRVELDEGAEDAG
jgi:RNA polymerase sigma factor (sigma-70 family)